MIDFLHFDEAWLVATSGAIAAAPDYQTIQEDWVQAGQSANVGSFIAAQ